MKSASIAAIALVLAAAAPGESRAQAAWQVYTDPEFGTRISYPAELFPETAPMAEGTVFSGRGASVQVSARAVEGVRTAADLRAVIAGTPGYEDMTYSPQGDRWLVVSGYRGGDVYYEKFFLVGGTVQGFSIQYPEAERRTYDPVVERMEDSFRAGR